MIYIFICQPPKTVLTFSSTESSVDTTQTVTDGEIKQTITTRIYGINYVPSGEYVSVPERLHYWGSDSSFVRETFIQTGEYDKRRTPIDSIVQTRCYKESECGE